MGKKTFSFKFIDKKKIFHELQKLKSKKASQGSDIPLNIRKTLTSHFICNNFSNSLFSSYYPSNLENADITFVFIKEGRENVENSHSVSILPFLSKVCEGCIYD